MPYFFDNIGKRKIIILSTVTDGWTEEEKDISNTCLQQIQSDITSAGFSNKLIEINSSTDLKNKLSKLNPDKVVIFNWVEEIDNLKYGYHVAPKILKEMGFIYTGNNSETLINSNNKIKIKKLLQKYNVSTPKHITLTKKSTDLKGWNIYPCIIKPANEHCSYGITHKSVVDNEKELLKRAKKLFSKFNQSLIVEEFIDGIEYFVSSWGYDNCEILPPVCQDYSYAADYHYRIYDYIAKWNSKTRIYHRCNLRLPAELNPDIPQSLYSEVTKAIQATGGQGYCRVDVRVKNNIPYIIDINHNPDITIESDFTIASSRLGYNYGQTILKLCDLAIQNYQQNIYTNTVTTAPVWQPSAPAYATLST